MSLPSHMPSWYAEFQSGLNRLHQLHASLYHDASQQTSVGAARMLALTEGH